MADIPQFVVCPPLRCQQPVGGRPRLFCGELARWMRPGTAVFTAGYFCDAHRESGDGAIPADVVVRRVQLHAEILFAGTSLLPGEAQTEAVARLEAAVHQAGGVFNLCAASSCVGRYAAHTAPVKAKGGRGREL